MFSEEEKFLQLGICRYIGEETAAPQLVIDGATVVRKSVRNHQVAHLQYGVVADNLIERRLRYFHLRGFVFDDDERPTFGIVDERVATAFAAVLQQRNFIAHTTRRIAFFVYQISNEVLPHPFFGRERDITLAQGVEYRGLAVLLFQTERICRQIQGYHSWSEICAYR